MTNKKLTFGKYKIIPIKLDVLHDWSYNFMKFHTSNQYVRT